MSVQIINKNNNPKRIALLQKELDGFRLQLKTRIDRSHRVVHSLQELADRKKVEAIKHKLNDSATI